MAAGESRAPVMRRFILTPAQIKLIRATVARHCNADEFDHFIAVAERTGLDPLRRQIHALITNAADPQRRSMTPQAGIDGLRAIAARHGDYRPMETAPEIEFDPARRDDACNPLGIVRAKVVVWKRFERDWFPIAGEAWWDEYAPGASTAEWGLAGGRAAVGRSYEARGAVALAANWRRMGRVLIAKCAEAQALRRGWPEDLSGLYGEEEMHRTVFDDALAGLRLAAHEAESSARQAGRGDSAALTFAAGAPPEAVALSDIVEKVRASLAHASAEQVAYFADVNCQALRQLWERDGATAFAVRKLVEAAEQRAADANIAPKPAEAPEVAEPERSIKRAMTHEGTADDEEAHSSPQGQESSNAAGARRLPKRKGKAPQAQAKGDRAARGATKAAARIETRDP